MSDVLKGFRPLSNPAVVGTPQTQKAAKGQKKNLAGGYGFVVSPLDVAKRFLILGSDKSYYQSGEKNTEFNAKNLIKLIEDGFSAALVDLIVEVSTEGRAPKQQPGLFALAVASSYGTAEEKAYAMSKLSAVARTGTTLFEYVGYSLQFRKFGSAWTKAIARWYSDKDVAKLAFQLVKYQSRGEWDHSRLLRISHPKGDEDFNGLTRWVLRGDTENIPAIVQGFVKAKDEKLTDAQLVKLAKDFGLSWEMIPSERRNKNVWEGLLKADLLPLGALIRQLATLSRLGVLAPMSKSEQLVVAKITDAEQIKRARLHPIQILIAMRTYQSGRSERGTSTWKPNRKVIDALDDAFYLAFKTAESTGLRYLLALDVSGSMQSAVVGSSLEAREATAAVSLALAKLEPYTHTIGFTGGGSGYGWGRTKAVRNEGGRYGNVVTQLDISPRQRLTDAVDTVSNLPYGRTDCSLPMQYAQEREMDIDVFIVMTDNETYAGSIHPFEALKAYRQAMGKPEAKLIVLSTQATGRTIADPRDPGMLDIVGFDSAVPQLIAEFAKGL